MHRVEVSHCTAAPRPTSAVVGQVLLQRQRDQHVHCMRRRAADEPASLRVESRSCSWCARRSPDPRPRSHRGETLPESRRDPSSPPRARRGRCRRGGRRSLRLGDPPRRGPAAATSQRTVGRPHRRRRGGVQAARIGAGDAEPQKRPGSALATASGRWPIAAVWYRRWCRIRRRPRRSDALKSIGVSASTTNWPSSARRDVRASASSASSCSSSMSPTICSSTSSMVTAQPRRRTRRSRSPCGCATGGTRAQAR